MPGYDTRHLREENGDYFLLRCTDTGTVFVVLYIAIARYWEVYVAGTKVNVPLDSPVAAQVITEAYVHAVLHPEDVTGGLLADARAYIRRRRALGDMASLVTDSETPVGTSRREEEEEKP